MRYIDLHCDTLMNCFLDGVLLRDNNQQFDLSRSKDAGLMLQCMAIFIPTNDVAKKHGVQAAPEYYFHACLEVYNAAMEENRDIVAPVLSAGDIAKNAEDGKMSALLTLEDGVIVGGKLERLKDLYKLGVRLITLTWNYENCFGFPQSADADAMKLGLKPFGIEAVSYMNELGIVIDVSHLSEGGFNDVARYSRKPFAASHSCSRALCDVSRNLNDRQLRVLGEKGGVCGVSFVPAFIKKDSVSADTDSVVRHIRYIADKAGIDAVAFGSDFDGFSGELEFKDCAGMPILIDELSKVFPEREVEKICSGNALRLLNDNLVQLG
ncbi:MAG: dipeptidase [Oscillospiraceae bacterium]|nr:dipeptidase [Oscillospiraceae bacterium]